MSDCKENPIITQGERIILPLTIIGKKTGLSFDLTGSTEIEFCIKGQSANIAKTLSGGGIVVVDEPKEDGYITPVDCAGEWATFVSRIREDPTVDHGLAMWVVSDNLRKGAALNAVQIAEELLNRGVITPEKAE